ncbi:MAG: sigma-70 family RNA polymerase sigma factor [Deltaproteobacteria bacterium]|nr:sigma-70 family RNA polymerase sigma factor [Deltaproteobacteria bacterium]
MGAALRERFLHALESSLRAGFEASSDLDARLDACAQQVEEQHGLVVDDPTLGEALAGAVERVDAFEGLNAGDLYLAVICGRGEAAGLRRFSAAYGAELDRAIAKSPTLGLSAPEFRQLVLDRLFVHEDDRPPRILSYRGRGTLKAWVRVMASRFIIDLSRRRSEPASEGDDALADRLAGGDDTELDYLRHAYGPQLSTAFGQAVAALTVRQRNLLRQRYLHELSAGALARLYGVHRSTVFLWLDKARAALLEQVRTALAERVPGHQLESMVGMLGSGLQVSVRRMLDSKLETEGS